MAEIQLTKGYVAIVDDADLDWLSQHKWFVNVDRNGCAYALRWDAGASRNVYMHREITGAGKGVLCDHRSGDGLDNRRANLRLCTKAQNERNAGPRKGRKYKGTVSRGSRWRAFICAGRTRHYLGSFPTEEDAARAYDLAAAKLHGDFAWLNFPAKREAA